MALHLSCSLAENSIDEGHDGSLQINFISVTTCGSVQICQQGLHTNRIYSLHTVMKHHTFHAYIEYIDLVLLFIVCLALFSVWPASFHVYFSVSVNGIWNMINLIGLSVEGGCSIQHEWEAKSGVMVQSDFGSLC